MSVQLGFPEAVSARVRAESFRRPLQAVNHSELSIIERVIANFQRIIKFLIITIYNWLSTNLRDELKQPLRRLYNTIYGADASPIYYHKNYIGEYKLNNRNIIFTMPPTVSFKNERGVRVDGVTPISANIILTYSQNIDEKLYNTGVTHKILSNVNMNAGIFSFAWNENENLLVGCKQGVCIFRFQCDKSKNNLIFIDDYADFIQHPLRQQIDSIEAPAHGHIFATYTYGDEYIYIWDSTVGNVSPVRIINNHSIFGISWSLSSGLYIYAYSLQALSAMETNSWTQSRLNLAYDNPQNDDILLDDILLVWISGYSCIYTHPKVIGENAETNLYSIYMNPNDPNSNAAFLQEPENLNKFFGNELFQYRIYKMVVNRAGNLLAVCFLSSDGLEYKIHVFKMECKYKFKLLGLKGEVRLAENEFVIDFVFQESDSSVESDALIVLCNDYKLEIVQIIANQNNS